jgi:21S rRNA (uridine2791-2'-O)-methyltransferase
LAYHNYILHTNDEPVAIDRTLPNGRVLGIDIIPAQPPKGVSTIQGNFLSPAVQAEVKKFLRESDRGRTRKKSSLVAEDEEEQMTEEDLEQSSRSYIEIERRAEDGRADDGASVALPMQSCKGVGTDGEGRMVDVVLSDMSEPWAQTEGFWKRSLSDPYYRMMNTSGMSFRDHAGSMVIRMSASVYSERLTKCPAGFGYRSTTLRL